MVGESQRIGPGESPREVALRILDGLFGAGPHQPRAGEASGAFSLADFQEEAVHRLRRILARRGGAVLADSVGLGKTYVALALIEEALGDGGDVLVVVPAAVRGLWRRALGRLPASAGRPRLVSHTQLARGVGIRPRLDRPDSCGASRPARLVVVDEAHRFRNPRTLRYAALARLVVPGSRLLLITATPVNNGPADLLHLLRLFAPDDLFLDVGVPSLRGAFEAAVGAEGPDGGTGAERAHGLAGAGVAAVVRTVVVRRTRAMVRDRFDACPAGPPGVGAQRRATAPRPCFPVRAAPRVVRYDRPDLAGAVRAIAELELMPYSLHDGPAGPGPAASGLIRLNLLKRLDSSPAAFEASIARLHRLLRATLDAARVGQVLTLEANGARGRSADADPLQLTLVALVAERARPDMDLPALMASLQRDLAAVRGLRSGRESPIPRRDPKLEALTSLLDGACGDRTVVFTEYRDTAEALWRALATRHRVGRVDGAGAWLGLRPAGRRLVVERFAPVANGSPPPPELERVDVLIATDVLAEGVNLQDARLVVSYDLPWNPVRLLQRIGRVDRLGSPHDVIVPFLFAPEQGLEEMLGLTRRLRRKLGHIAATVGAEQADALLERLASPGLFSDAAASRLEDLLGAAGEAGGDPLEALRTLWIRHRKRGGEGGRGDADRLREVDDSREWALPDPTPPVVRQAELTVPPDHPAAALAWVVLGQHRGTPTLLEVGRDGTVAEAGEPAVAALAHALSVPGVRAHPPDPPAHGALPGHNLPFEAIRDHFVRARVAGSGPPRMDLNDPRRRLTRRIRTALARAGSALDPAGVQRADAVLTRLAVPLDPTSEERVRALLEEADGAPVHALLAAAESALGPPRGARDPGPAGSVRGAPPGSGGPTLRAALRVRAPTESAPLPESG